MGRFSHIVEAFEKTQLTLPEITALPKENSHNFLDAYATVRELDELSTATVASVEEPAPAVVPVIAPAFVPVVTEPEATPEPPAPKPAGRKTERHYEVIKCSLCAQECRGAAGLSAHMRFIHKDAKTQAAEKVIVHDGYARPLTPPERAGRLD